MTSEETLDTALQMVKKPYTSSEEWDAQVERRPATCTFGIEPVTHPFTRFTTDENEVIIKFKCKERLHHFLNFYYQKDNTRQKVEGCFHILYEVDDTVVCHIRFQEAGAYFAKFGAEVRDGHGALGPTLTGLMYRINVTANGAIPYPNVLNNRLWLQSDFEGSGFTLLSPTTPIIDTSDGKATVVVKLPTSGVVSSLFSFYKSEDGGKTTEVKGLVYGEKKGSIARFHIQCPEKGEYKLEIFAKFEEGESLSLAMTVLICCHGVNQPLFYHPKDKNVLCELAGPNEHFYRLGLATTQNSSTLKFKDGVAALYIRKTKPAKLLAELELDNGEDVNDLLKTSDAGDEECFTVMKPNVAGYYWLTLYAKEATSPGSYPFAGSFCIPFNVQSNGI